MTQRTFDYTEALARFDAGISQRQLANDYGVTTDAIRRALRSARRAAGRPDLGRARVEVESLPPNCGFCGRRFSKRWLPRHEAKCQTAGDRFQLLAVTGYAIDPRTSKAAGSSVNRPASTSYVVCDSHNEWLEVGWFDPEGRTSELARAAAERKCRKLNENEQQAEPLSNGRPREYLGGVCT